MKCYSNVKMSRGPEVVNLRYLSDWGQWRHTGAGSLHDTVVRHFQLTEEHGQIVLLLHQNLQLGRSHVLDLERLQRSDQMLARIVFEVA